MAKKEWVYTKKRRETFEKKAKPKLFLYVKIGKEEYNEKHKHN